MQELIKLEVCAICSCVHRKGNFRPKMPLQHVQWHHTEDEPVIGNVILHATVCLCHFTDASKIWVDGRAMMLPKYRRKGSLNCSLPDWARAKYGPLLDELFVKQVEQFLKGTLSEQSQPNCYLKIVPQQKEG